MHSEGGSGQAALGVLGACNMHVLCAGPHLLPQELLHAVWRLLAAP